MLSRFNTDQIKKLVFYILLFPFVIGCSSEKQGNSKAEKIIQKAMQAHGGSNYKDVRIHFEFRDKHYTTTLKNGYYRYVRKYSDSSLQIKEVLTNDSLYQTINGMKVELSGKEKASIKGSLNSVNYFFLLPYRLEDEAVVPEYIGKTKIKGEPYHKIKVTFRQKKGGKDHEDIYLYWFHRKQNTMDYLAYKFFVDEGGMRFRVANNIREIGGIRFQDYLNLAPESKGANFMKIDSLYKAGALNKVSEINKDSIRVEDI